METKPCCEKCLKCPDYSKHDYCHDKDCPCHNPHSTYLARFDERFGSDGPDKNSDSIGRAAGCDDCAIGIQIRAEHKQFLIECLKEEGKRAHKEGFDKGRYLYQSPDANIKSLT